MTSGHLFATRAESVAFEHAVFTTGNNTRNSRRELRKLECYPCKILHRNNTKCPLNSNHTKLGKQNVNSMKQKATKMSNYISRSSSKIKIPSILMLMLICLLLAITIKTTVATTSRLPPNHLNTNQKDHDIEQQQQAAHRAGGVMQSHRLVPSAGERDGNSEATSGVVSDDVARDNGHAIGEKSHRERRRTRRGANTSGRANRVVRSPATLALISEMRISGSKSEPPSRPSVDWSKQRPYFGPDMQRNVSVELGKTAYLVCKVYELGDKTVSWLRPRENEILTAGRYTYIGDSRFSSINDNGSHDWILEIKDVGLNDSTSYECQVSTDPKMSTIINLHVKAAKARIKQGEQFYAPLGSNIEFTCEIMQRHLTASASATSQQTNQPPQTYWYHNGNLINYAKAHLSVDKNFSIEWEPISQTSRFKLFNSLASDAGNYTCKPTSAEPATIRLHVKKPSQKSSQRDRMQQHNGYHKDMRNRQHQLQQQHHYGVGESLNGLELMDSSSALKLGGDFRLLLGPVLVLCLLMFRM